MEFPHTYFHDEVREGFYVSGAIKRVWAAQLAVLDEIDKVCRRHGITWYADCGTLLGAVRHGGYVPWDDDLDICMLRDDYVRFNEVAEQELPKEYVVLNLHKEEVYYEYVTRVTNGHGLNFEEEHLQKYHECPYAVGIDIFPLDYLSPDPERVEEQRNLAAMLLEIADEVDFDCTDAGVIEALVPKLNGLVEVKIQKGQPIRQQLFKLTERVFSLYPREGAEYVALMRYWSGFHNHRFPIRYFERTVQMPYETGAIPVPWGYDGVLRGEYGEYMRLMKGGAIHEYPVFRGQEEYLIGLLKKYPYKYKFKKQDLKNEYRMPCRKSGQDAEYFVSLVRQAHDRVLSYIQEEQFDFAIELVQECQAGAIQIGTEIEEEFGEGYGTVKLLEAYCELLYEVSQILAEDVVRADAISHSVDALNKLLDAIAKSVHEDINEKRQIVFMPFRGCDWPMLEDLWREAVADARNLVYVIPVPYYERGAKGIIREQYYEGDCFPEYVPITSYESYDLEKRHPDVIYFQNPYDECNYTVNLVPDYYSKNLKRFTERLIYVPWFLMDEIAPNNEKGVFTMNYFCTVPGLFHADSILVQSEQMRNRYIQCLTEFAGEDTHSIWEEKITWRDFQNTPGAVTTADRKNQELLEALPEDWKGKLYKSDGKRKKVLLFSLGVYALVQYENAITEKMESVSEAFFGVADEMVVLWRIERETKDTVESAYPALTKGLEQIREQWEQETWCICDDTHTENWYVDFCDAYYGTRGTLAHRCRLAGKPVLILSV